MSQRSTGSSRGHGISRSSSSSSRSSSSSSSSSPARDRRSRHHRSNRSSSRSPMLSGESSRSRSKTRSRSRSPSSRDYKKRFTREKDETNDGNTERMRGNLPVTIAEKNSSIDASSDRHHADDSIRSGGIYPSSNMTTNGGKGSSASSQAADNLEGKTTNDFRGVGSLAKPTHSKVLTGSRYKGIQFGKPGTVVRPGIQMKLAQPKPPSETTKKITVASAFNNDSDEEVEEMPPECKMRMRNIGRDTPTSSGPNSFGKTKQGFIDSKKLFEKSLREAAMD